MVRIYGPRVRLCLTDIDSLYDNIRINRINDVYIDMANSLERFDTCEFLTIHPCYSSIIKKKWVIFSNEKTLHILEIVRLIGKCYSLFTLNRIKYVAKGVPRFAIKNQLKHG